MVYTPSIHRSIRSALTKIISYQDTMKLSLLLAATATNALSIQLVDHNPFASFSPKDKHGPSLLLETTAWFREGLPIGLNVAALERIKDSLHDDVSVADIGSIVLGYDSYALDYDVRNIQEINEFFDDTVEERLEKLRKGTWRAKNMPMVPIQAVMGYIDPVEATIENELLADHFDSIADEVVKKWRIKDPRAQLKVVDIVHGSKNDDIVVLGIRFSEGAHMHDIHQLVVDVLNLWVEKPRIVISGCLFREGIQVKFKFVGKDGLNKRERIWDVRC